MVEVRVMRTSGALGAKAAYWDIGGEQIHWCPATDPCEYRQHRTYGWIQRSEALAPDFPFLR